MNDTGYIEITTHKGPFGSIEHIDWHWEGDLIWLDHSGIMHALAVGALRSYPKITIGEVFNYGPYRVRVVDIPEFAPLGSCMVMRDGWKSRTRVVVYKIVHHWDWVYYRLIMTLAIWGLAERDPGEKISWRNIKLVKRFAERAGHH